MNFINLEQLENKNLKLVLTEEGREKLEDLIKEEKIELEILEDLLEYNSCNGQITFVLPNEIGALTDSIILSTDYEYKNEESEERNYYNIFWFPNYMVVNLAEKLLEDGQLIFTNSNNS